MSVSTAADAVDGSHYGNPYRSWETMRRCHPGHGFPNLDESLLAARATADAFGVSGVEMSKHSPLHFFRPCETSSASFYGSLESATSVPIPPSCTAPRPAHQMTPHHSHLYTSSLDHAGTASVATVSSFDSTSTVSHVSQLSEQTSHMTAQMATSVSRGYPTPSSYVPAYATPALPSPHGAAHGFSPPYTSMPQMHELDYDPRELEAFAERFKQRRIKLGVTQADVGRALGNLKLPGVGSLSQSTICRFESLTLSHNNMIALKPVLEAWLKEAERQASERQKNADIYGESADKKRKRTSITDAEKRSLEAYFAVQPRPSSEKIAQIAEKLNLRKNVVRVWFCNQRQKQKRMKFSSVAIGHSS